MSFTLAQPGGAGPVGFAGRPEANRIAGTAARGAWRAVRTRRR